MAEKKDNVWELSRSKPINFEPNVDNGWRKLQSRIEQEDAPARVFPLYRMMAMAASVALLLAIGFWVVQNNGANTLTWEQIETTTDEVKAIQLADNSQITLNEGTYFSHPTDFADDARTVELDGEAFFDIAKDESRPFSIKMDHGTVKVLGTSFNIYVNHKKNTTTITVAEGSVSFSPQHTSEQFVLKAGDKFVYDANRSTSELSVDHSKNDWSWKTGRLNFDGTKLQEAIPAIEKHYGIRIDLENKALLTCRSIKSGGYNGLALNDFMEAFSVTLGIDVQRQNDGTYLWSGGSCLD